jgi:riboflavin synthase
MFSGIVEEAGQVAKLVETPQGIRLSITAELVGSGAKIGDSVAVNGCCLTLVETGPTLSFDLLSETWQRTNFRAVNKGSLVNLERSLPADGRLHGHFVTGHIDGTGRILVFEQRGPDWYLKIAAAPEVLRYVVFKGAIAVDGISLTVAEVHAESFAVWIIPHTYAATALRARQVGALVNLEADLLAKYVEKLVAT